jgi:cytoskeletal protein RodZ
METFGQWLKNRRGDRSQRDFAADLRISAPYLCALERDRARGRVRLNSN